MLLPALAKARAKARSITCVNALKQNVLALLMYADDNNQMVVRYEDGGGLATAGQGYPYRFAYAGVLLYCKYMSYGNNLRCPLWGKPEGLTATDIGIRRGYSMYNGSKTAGADLTDKGKRVAVDQLSGTYANIRSYNIGVIDNPTTFPAIEEGWGASQKSDFCWNEFGNPAGGAFLVFAHDAKTNTTWMDGHATSDLRGTIKTTLNDAGYFKFDRFFCFDETGTIGSW